MTPTFLRACVFAALSAVAFLPAFAAPPAATTAPDKAQAPAPVIQVAPAAEEPVMVVNSYMAALASGQVEAARNFMMPEAVVIANGRVLGNRDSYFSTQARSDAAQLQGTQRALLHRNAAATPAVAWVVSEKLLRTDAAGKASAQVVTETVLVGKTAEGWKIFHIHRSSRPAS